MRASRDMRAPRTRLLASRDWRAAMSRSEKGNEVEGIKVLPLGRVPEDDRLHLAVEWRPACKRKRHVGEEGLPAYVLKTAHRMMQGRRCARLHIS